MSDQTSTTPQDAETQNHVQGAESTPVEIKEHNHTNGHHVEAQAEQKNEEKPIETESSPQSDQPAAEAKTDEVTPKTPIKEKTPAKAKSEKKSTAKKEKASTAKKSAAKEKEANKSTAKKQKKSDDEQEKKPKEEKRGRSNSAKKETKPQPQKVEKVPVTSKSRERKIDTDEFSKYANLLNKKTTRAKKPKEVVVPASTENN